MLGNPVYCLSLFLEKKHNCWFSAYTTYRVRFSLSPSDNSSWLLMPTSQIKSQKPLHSSLDIHRWLLKLLPWAPSLSLLCVWRKTFWHIVKARGRKSLQSLTLNSLKILSNERRGFMKTWEMTNLKSGIENISQP